MKDRLAQIFKLWMRYKDSVSFVIFCIMLAIGVLTEWSTELFPVAIMVILFIIHWVPLCIKPRVAKPIPVPSPGSITGNAQDDEPLNVVLVVDVDSHRPPPQVIIETVMRVGNGLRPVQDGQNVVDHMATLCEGLCTLIHAADQSGEKEGAQSLRDCIHHLEQGFIDAGYKASTILGTQPEQEPEQAYQFTQPELVKLIMIYQHTDTGCQNRGYAEKYVTEYLNGPDVSTPNYMLMFEDLEGLPLSNFKRVKQKP